MVDVDDSTAIGTTTLELVALKAYAEIVDIQAPAKLKAGDLLEIMVQIKNTGNGGSRVYAYLKDRDTGTVIIPKFYNVSTLNPTEQIGIPLEKYRMPQKNLSWQVVAGHVEE